MLVVNLVWFSSVQSWERNQALQERRQDNSMGYVNAPHDTPEEYYRRNPFIPFLV